MLQEVNKVQFEDRPVPELKDPHDVLVEVKFTGICGSDVCSQQVSHMLPPDTNPQRQVHYWSEGRIGDFVVRAPMVLGHESAGVVHSVGAAVTSLQPGDKVAMEPGVPCRRCVRCREGKYNLCLSMAFAATPPHDGTLARFYVLPEDFCHKLPDHMTLEEGALIEPASVGVHVCRQVGVAPGQSVVVYGAGPVGLLCCAVSKAFGATKVVCVDINEERLEFAAKYAATHIFRSKKESAEEGAERLVQECGLGLGADCCIDATGAAPCIQAGIHVLRTGGTYCQAGMVRLSGSFSIVVQLADN